MAFILPFYDLSLGSLQIREKTVQIAQEVEQKGRIKEELQQQHNKQLEEECQKEKQLCLVTSEKAQLELKLCSETSEKEQLEQRLDKMQLQVK